MKVLNYHYPNKLDIKEPIAIAVGYFDGIHLGHAALVNKITNYAKKNNIKSAMLTLSTSPLVTLGKIEQEYVLTSVEDKCQILQNMGVDYLIVIDFNKEVALLEPDVFFEHFIQKLPIQYLVCGFDYHFGKQGKGDANYLRQLAKPYFKVDIQEEVVQEHAKISSSRIRSELTNGNIGVVNELLGRVYNVQGIVIKGRQIGRKIGFPTVNVDYGNYLIPKNGVYGVKVVVDGNTFIGMCNIGFNPTFDRLDHPSLEVNIFDFNEDIYGKVVKVYFYCFIRKETKFESVNDLIQQLENDRIKIEYYFNNENQ